MKKPHGFTLIELIVVVIFLSLSAAIFFYQMSNIEASQRDNDRKTAINAMYYNLEEVFYEKNGYYPVTVDSKILTAMDAELFNDPQGNTLGTATSNYRYDPIDCQNDRCRSYSLTSSLTKEADYVKKSRNN